MKKQSTQEQALDEDMEPSAGGGEGFNESLSTTASAVPSLSTRTEAEDEAVSTSTNANSARGDDEEEKQPNPAYPVGAADNNGKDGEENIVQGPQKPHETDVVQEKGGQNSNMNNQKDRKGSLESKRLQMYFLVPENNVRDTSVKDVGYQEQLQQTPLEKDGTTMNPGLVEDPAKNLVPPPPTEIDIDVDELPPALPQTQLLRATGRARRPESVPGAVQVGGTPGQVEALEALEEGYQEPGSQEREPSERSLSDRHLLVEATPVAQDSSANLSLVQADEVDPTNRKRSKSKHLRELALIALPIALVAAIVIAAVVLTKNRGPEEEGEKPSSKRTLPIDEHILSLLPTRTVNDINDDNESAQSEAYRWLLADPSVLSYSDTRLVQRFALVVFFESLGGPDWFRNDNWKTYKDECTWYFGSTPLPETASTRNEAGISPLVANAHTTVVVRDGENNACRTWDNGIPTEEYKQIALFNNGLRGTLPDELFLLTGLEILGLFGNSISGTIPQAVAQMSHLIGLTLMANKLTGTIPPELPTSLRMLFLNGCRFSGSLPSTLGRLNDLEHLWVDDTPLTGTIPSQLGNLGKLQVLSLWGCGLTGTLPTEISNLSSLWLGLLQYNSLSGQLPSELGLLMRSEDVQLDGVLERMPSLYLHGITSSYMGRLFLEVNAFTGTIPTELASMFGLKGLSIGHSLFSGEIPTQVGLMKNLLSLTVLNTPFSQIPSEIGLLTKLSDLIMPGNQISQIPSQIFTLSNLQKIHLHQNLLHSIPSEVGLLSDAKQLLLFLNRLTGQIPIEVARLSKLDALMVHENALTGQIPTQLGLMTQLSLLMIQGNRLEGTLPSGVGGLEKLQFLYASRNNLNGTIPNLQGLSDLWELRLDNNDFSGPIPTNLGLPSLEILSLNNNDLNSSIPSQLGQLSALQRVMLQNNNLTGSLPPQVSLLSELIVLLLSQNKLTGTIPTVLNELPSLKLLNLTSNDFTGEIDTGLCNRSFTGPAGFWGTFTGPVDSGFYFDCGGSLCGCSCECSKQGGV